MAASLQGLSLRAIRKEDMHLLPTPFTLSIKPCCISYDVDSALENKHYDCFLAISMKGSVRFYNPRTIAQAKAKKEFKKKDELYGVDKALYNRESPNGLLDWNMLNVSSRNIIYCSISSAASKGNVEFLRHMFLKYGMDKIAKYVHASFDGAALHNNVNVASMLIDEFKCKPLAYEIKIARLRGNMEVLRMMEQT